MEQILSIIIPCYNEEQTVAKILDRVLAVSFGTWKREIIAIDDASNDSTLKILQEYEKRGDIILITQPKNAGKGAAVAAGLARARGSHMITQDADLEYDPRDIPKLLTYLAHNKVVVYGSRKMVTHYQKGDLLADLGARFIGVLINVLYGTHFTDVCTGYKLFPKDAAPYFRPGRFESEIFFTLDLLGAGYTFLETPISYHPRGRKEGKKIRYRDGVLDIFVIFRHYLARLLKF